MVSKYSQDIDEIKTGLAAIVPLVKCIPTLKETISSMRADVSGMASKIDALHESCPFREDIARGANSIQKIKDVKGEIKDLADKQNNDVAALKKAQSDAQLLSVKNLARLALIVAGAATIGSNVNLSGLLGLFG